MQTLIIATLYIRRWLIHSAQLFFADSAANDEKRRKSSNFEDTVSLHLPVIRQRLPIDTNTMQKSNNEATHEADGNLMLTSDGNNQDTLKPTLCQLTTEPLKSYEL